MSESYFNTPSPVEKVNFPELQKKNIELYVKRDDLIHKDISGNKWRKLKLNIEQAQFKGHDTLLTFGGAHSNHIAATAATADLFGMKSIGIIRGEEADITNPTLKMATEHGMQIHPVSRGDYKILQEWDSRDRLKDLYGHFYPIPQGGANYYGVQGCQEIISELEFTPNRIFVSTATATTLSGMAIANAGKSEIYGVSVLKGGGFLLKELEENLRQMYQDVETERFISEKIHVLLPYHFGGYARVNDELIQFMQNFTRETGIKLDPVYTAKTAFAMTQLAGKLNNLKPEKWLFIHTGGLQGIPAMEAKLGTCIYPDC